MTDYGQHEARSYLVMELLRGETLDHEISRLRRLSPQRVAEIVTQAARGLEVAHAEGVLHRDLKPANLFLSTDEHGGLLVKLLDFGVARAPRGSRFANATATGAGIAVGTPAYMSPEQACASVDIDLGCDLWALAATAYEALTGETPVSGHNTRALFLNLLRGQLRSLRQTRPELSEALARFFERAFARRPCDRYDSAVNMASAFRSAVFERVAPSRPDRTARIPIPVPRRPPDTLRLPPAAAAPRALRPRRALTLAFAAPLAVLALVGATLSRCATVNVSPRGHRTRAPSALRESVEWPLVVVPAAPISSPSPPTPPRALPPPRPAGVVDRSSTL